MMGNIYLLEKTLEREITERQAAQERQAQLRELQVSTADALPHSSAARVILRLGRLVVAWAVL